MLSSHSHSPQWTDSDKLTPGSFAAYQRKLFPCLAAFESAGQAIKTNTPFALHSPHIDDQIGDSQFRKNPVDEFDDLTAEGCRAYDYDCKDFERKLERHAGHQSRLILFLQSTLS